MLRLPKHVKKDIRKILHVELITLEEVINYHIANKRLAIEDWLQLFTIYKYSSPTLPNQMIEFMMFDCYDMWYHTEKEIFIKA